MILEVRSQDERKVLELALRNLDRTLELAHTVAGHAARAVVEALLGRVPTEHQFEQAEHLRKRHGDTRVSVASLPADLEAHARQHRRYLCWDHEHEEEL